MNATELLDKKSHEKKCKERYNKKKMPVLQKRTKIKLETASHGKVVIVLVPRRISHPECTYDCIQKEVSLYREHKDIEGYVYLKHEKTFDDALLYEVVERLLQREEADE